MSRSSRLPARALLLFVSFAALASAQANHGVIISEIGHGPSLPPVGGVLMPSYVELVNIQIANPVVPPPIPIGSPAAGNASLTGRVGTGAAITFPIPIGLLLGGNVQPPPAAQPSSLPVNPPVLVISSGPFPPGVLPAGITPILAPSFFSGPNANLGAPGLPFELCFNNPATGLGDRIHLGPPAGPACSAQPFTNTLTFVPQGGKAIRWVYFDSNTDIDFESSSTFAISPGAVNPQMTHVNGFFFGTTASPTIGGAPLQVNGSTAGTLGLSSLTARVKAVHFVNSFLNKTIANPAFDPVIGAQVSMTANFTALPATAASPPAGFLPGLQILNEQFFIVASTPQGNGILGMPMNVSTHVVSNMAPSYVPGDIRPERVFTDMVSDATPFVMGPSPTAAEIDVIPPSTGGGNVWCEVIVYDYAGNEYRAKVKNWPPGGTCMGPLLGLGTNGSQSLTLIDLCFNPGSTVANLFSASPAATCGLALLPPGGICPDSFTTYILTPPQFGALPFFPTVDTTGLYFFQIPTGTLAAFAGFTFEGIAVEYTGSGIVQQSAVNSILL